MMTLAWVIITAMSTNIDARVGVRFPLQLLMRSTETLVQRWWETACPYVINDSSWLAQHIILAQ